MTRRILTQVHGLEILSMLTDLTKWTEPSIGRSWKSMFDNLGITGKERLRYEAVLTAARDAREGKFALDDIKEILV